MTPKLTAAESAAKEWQAKAESKPSEQAERIKTLESQLRGRDAKDRLRDILRDRPLATGVDVDKIMKMAGFDPTAEGSDVADLGKMVAGLAESDPYLFRPAEKAEAAPVGAQKPVLQVSTPVGRGAPDKTSKVVRYTRDDIRDPRWMQSRPDIVAAIKDGTALLVE